MLLRLLIFTLLPISTIAKDNTNISGIIQNTSSDTAKFNFDILYLNAEPSSFIIPVNNGAFNCSFYIDKPVEANFIFKKDTINLFLEPGDSIFMSFKQGMLHETIKFSGKGGFNNTFLSGFYKKFIAHFNTKQMENLILNSGIDQFEIGIFENKNKALNFCKKYESPAQLTDTFKKYINNLIEYNYYRALLSYPIIKANNSTATVVQPIPEVMLSAVNEKLVNNKEAAICQAYRDFLYYYIVYYTSKENGFNKFTDYDDSMLKKCNYAKHHLSGETLLYFIAKYLYDNCTQISLETYQQHFRFLKNLSGSSSYLEIIDQKCGKLVATSAKKEQTEEKPQKINIQKKDEAIKNDFELIGLDEKKVLLKNFKGKVIYIDFWASWCGPCRQQFPHAKEMKAKLTKKQKEQIVFLYISVDNNYESWKKAVKALDIEGMHVIAPGDWNSEIAKYFNIVSIPRFVIIDKKGNIVNSNAKRPSEGVLQDLLQLIDK
ncbi:MAG: TlpA family protein disulfide reductase [Bacteroidia bacterium]|nr:TlpA family protein disulfide reductase [Bacteroidia bacterium]